MEYCKTRASGINWWIATGAPSSVAALTADPDTALAGPGSEPRRRVGRKRFYRLEAPSGPDLFVKVFRPPGALAACVGPSKARREAEIARAIEARGFAVAAPVAFGEERRLGILRRSFSVVPALDARDLRDLLSDPTTTARHRRELLVSFARLCRRLHEAGIDQDDTSPNNFLVDDDLRWTLIDFERCSLGGPLGDRRFTLLAKLHRHDLGVSSTDRLRFLRAYLGRDERALRRASLAKIQAAYVAVRRNDIHRAEKGAFSEGRNLTRDGDDWVVRGREGARVLRVELAPDDARRAWIRGLQLERLGLPCLRPARLHSSGVDWLAEAVDATPPSPGEVDRARARLERFGRFRCEPAWVSEAGRARLRSAESFEFDL